MRENDARLVATAIRRDFPNPEADAEPYWNGSPAAKIIDCVLSLNRPYRSVVAPRVNRFLEEHPEIRSCRQLREFMDRYASPAEFLEVVLNTRDARRASTLSGVLDYMLEAQHQFLDETEAARLRSWAKWARPGDYLAVNVPGFGLAGFQYLRLLFGAETTKPDVHIIGYVSEAVGREVSDAEAIYILEQAADLVDVPLSRLDSVIWKSRERAPAAASPQATGR
jgi:hypothetical protein